MARAQSFDPGPLPNDALVTHRSLPVLRPRASADGMSKRYVTSETEEIDLREVRRTMPPRAEMHQPFAGGRRPLPPAVRSPMTIIGAPIPECDVIGGPSWHRWTPRRRRRFRRTLLWALAGVALVVVLLAVASLLPG